MDETVQAFSPESFGRMLFDAPQLAALQLLLRSPVAGADFEALPDPFARIEVPGEDGTLFLGCIRGWGAPDAHVVIKVQRDTCGHSRSQAPTNAEAARVFEADHVALCLLGAEGAPVAAPLPGGSDGGGGVLPVLPPLFFCKRRRLFFVPPCPRCGGPLSDCQDDGLLGRFGLGPFAESTRRYLHCGRCAPREAVDRAALFACAVDEPELPCVADRWELIREWGVRVRAADAREAPRFPCIGCGSAQTCHVAEGDGPGQAQRLLVPFSFHGFRAFVHEYAPFRYDEFSDLVGGQPWDAFQQVLRSRRDFDRLQTSSGDVCSRTTRRFWYESGDDSRRWLETLGLKLAMFEQLCRGVFAAQRVLQRPHLAIRPANVLVGVGVPGPFAPAYWNLQVKLCGLDEQRGGGGAQPIRPPEEVDPAYSHPATVLAAVGEPIGGRLSILSVRPGEAAEQLSVRARLVASGREGRYGRGRRSLEVQFGRMHGFRREFGVSFYPVGTGGADEEVEAEVGGLAPEDRAQFESLCSVSHLEVRFRVRNEFGAECDLYSLGMMLFRSVLANSMQGADAVLQHCRRAGERLDTSVNGEGVDDLLRSELADPCFEPRNLRYEPSEDVALPGYLWTDVLDLGFRLVTSRADFGYQADAGTSDACALEERVLADVKRLRESAEAELRSPSAGAEGELRQVLSELIDDPEWLDRVLAPAAPAAREPPAAASPGREDTRSPAEAARRKEEATISPEPTQGGPVLEETVILRRGSSESSAAPLEPGSRPRSQDRLGPEPDLGATVILKRGGSATDAPRPGDVASGRPSPGPGEGAREEDAEEDLEKTILVRPSRRPPGQ